MLDSATVDALRLALQGQDLTDRSPMRLKGLVRDVCAGKEAEANLLSIAIDAKVPQELLRGSEPNAFERERLHHRLQKQFFIGEEAARWAVDAWVSALGLNVTEAPTTIIPSEGPPPLQTPASRETSHINPLSQFKIPPKILPYFLVFMLISVALILQSWKKHSSERAKGDVYYTSRPLTTSMETDSNGVRDIDLGVPFYPGSKEMSIEGVKPIESGSGRVRFATQRSTEDPEDKVLNYYRDAAAKAGFYDIADDSGGGDCGLDASMDYSAQANSGAGVVLYVRCKKNPETGRTVVFVNLSKPDP